LDKKEKMNWTKDRPTKPGKYAAIHLHEDHSGYAKVKIISIADDLIPPPTDSESFDWARYDAPMENWIRVLVGWETGGDGPVGLDWFTWFCELELPAVPEEIAKIQAEQAKSESAL